MKKSKIILGTIIGVSTASILTGIGLGAMYAAKVSSYGQLNPNLNTPVMFDNKEFSNYEEAYEYALKSVSNEKFDSTNKKLLSLNVDGTTYIFETPDELNDFISSKIKMIENATTNETTHNLNDDQSIPLNELYKYNINTENDTTFENNITTIYKRADGMYFDGGEEALNKAKESYLEIHKCYNFNGIYFKTKQDLELYLKNIYVEQIKNGISASAQTGGVADTNNYKKVYINDETGRKIATSESIYFKDNNTKDYVSNFLSSNAYKYLKIKNGDPENKNDVYLKYNKYTNEIEGNLSETISIEDLPVLKKVSTDNKSLYIVDANVNEKYNLYGPYFLKTDGNVTNITNPDMWIESEDSPEQIIRSQSISILAGFFDLLLLDPKAKDQYQQNHEGYVERKWDPKSPLFYISEISKQSSSPETKTLFDKEQAMLNALKKVTINTNNGKTLYQDFVNMYNNLINTKSYSTIYAIPTIYNFITDNLMNYNASVEVVIAVKEYFEELCNTIQGILESTFGDLLNSYDGLKRFNFAEFFQINQYGNDGSNMGGILNGYELIKTYKPLIAGCYVLIRGLGNSQSTIKVNYSVSSDNDLFKLLEDGKDSENQETAEKIKNTWSNNADANGKTTIDKLQEIYNTYSSLGDITDEYVKKVIQNIGDVSSLDQNEKIDKIYDSLVDEKITDGLNNLKSDFIDKLDQLNKVLSNQELETTFIFKNLLGEQFKIKASTNIQGKANSLKEAKKLLNNDSNCDWKTNGFLKGASDSDIKKVKNKLSQKLDSGDLADFTSDTDSLGVVNKIKTKVEPAELISALVGGIGSITETAINMANQINNPFFDDVQGQIIAAGVMNICASVCNIVGQFTPPPINVIVQAVGFIFSFISAGIGTAEQVIYEYNVKDSEGHKYYWDGGLVMNRFWGLWRDEQRGIEDLKVQSPIEIIKPSNKEEIYFNKKMYTSDNDGIVRKKAVQYILNNYDLDQNTKDNKFSWVYSLEPITKNLNNQNTFDSIEKLADDVVNNGTNTMGVGDELFINGIKFNDMNDLESKIKSEVLDKIQPIYIAKIPEKDINGYPLDEQTSFHIPFPYYEPFNEKNENLIHAVNEKNEFVKSNAMYWRNTKTSKIRIDVQQNQDYISYNANSVDSSTYALPINQIYELIKNQFLENLNIESKTVLKSNLISSKYIKFDDFNSSIKNLNIYLVELTPGVKKYFINRDDAVEYILKETSNNGDIKLSMNDYELLAYTDSNGEKLYFNNQDQFNKWFINNIKEKNKEGV